jgi:hypothetical protein
MKKHFFPYVFFLALFAIGMSHSCKKTNSAPLTVPPPPVSASFVEEFSDVNSLMNKGWKIGEYSQADTLGLTDWTQGSFGTIGKGDTTWYGFAAYSYTQSPDEYVYSHSPAMDSNLSISSWLLTPVLIVKNGDMVSFYTRGDTTGIYTDRMQVLLNKLGSDNIGSDLNSVGDFSTVLYDINSSQAPGGYPTSWTKYEYTFTGITGTMNIRLAFRHYVVHPTNARGVGVDLFKFVAN